MKLGVHVSSAGGVYQAVDRAVALSCEAFQIFSRNPRGWQSAAIPAADAAEFRRRRKAAGIAFVAVHIPYLINLASPEEKAFQRSLGAYRDDIRQADALGADFFVTHIGNHLGEGVEFGLRRIADGLKLVLSETRPALKVLLENTAGSGTGLGRSPEEIARIIDLAGKEGDKLGVCFDTAHAYGAGYRVNTGEGLEAFLGSMERLCGRERLALVHANDSRAALGSRVDRHADIGAGEIGLEGFRVIVNHPRLKEMPFILETPKKSPEADRENLAVIRSLVAA